MINSAIYDYLVVIALMEKTSKSVRSIYMFWINQLRIEILLTSTLKQMGTAE